MKVKIVCFLGTIMCAVSAFSQDSIALKYANTITVEDLTKHLKALASDEYEGRETGEIGQKMAAEYISNQFKNSGIPPNKTGYYYQDFPLIRRYPEGISVSVNNKKYEFLKDYYYFSGFEDQQIDVSQVLFLGYGINDPKYNDYEGNKVKDKVILILSGEPFNKDTISLLSEKKAFSEWSTVLRKKTEAARKEGVKALLVVVNNIEGNVKQYRRSIISTSVKLDAPEKKPENPAIPVIYISKKIADDILSEQQLAVDTIKQTIKNTLKPFFAKSKTNLLIEMKRTAEKALSQNVFAYIEGSDFKNELVVMSAHYDHLGKDGEVVYNGADDDGSGTTAVIENAEAFITAKKEGHGPKRSMLFIAFSGEEKGLLGSTYYSENPVFPLQNTVADLNIDMVGRVDEKHKDSANYIYVIGADRLSSQLHAINELMNKTYTKLDLDYTYNDPNDPNSFYTRSDHYNFAKHNIPSVFYFNGTHSDYHKETDEVEKIDFGKLKQRAQLVFYTAWELANRRERIVVDVLKEK